MSVYLKMQCKLLDYNHRAAPTGAVSTSNKFSVGSAVCVFFLSFQSDKMYSDVYLPDFTKECCVLS
jgi:hypothetical protein